MKNLPDKTYLKQEVVETKDKDFHEATKTWEITWSEERLSEHDPEYIRKDVFIKKACDAYCKVCGHYAHSVPTHICRHDCNYFSDFKKYMKGEEV